MRLLNLDVLHIKIASLQERSFKDKAQDRKLQKSVAKGFISIIAGTIVIYATTDSL